MDQAQHLEVMSPHLTRADQTDEISLVDLALVVWRHRRAALATMLTFVVLGIAAALWLPKKYAYTTTIEIGVHIEDDKTVPIERPDTTLAKIRESYIPLARQHYLEAHADESRIFKVEARIPERQQGSQLIVLESTAAARDAPAYQEIQQQVVQEVVADHSRVFNVVRSGIELAKQRAVADLDVLKDGEQFLLAEQKRTEQSADLLKQQIADTTALIEAARKNRASAVREATDEARAMTLLMLDSEVQQNRTRLATLDERLQVGLAQRRDRLNNQLRENQRKQAIQEAEVQRLAQRLENLLETRAVVAAMQSHEPVGISRSMIAILSVFLGGLMALLVVFGLEFRARVRAALGGAASDTVSAEATEAGR